jgi:hypothetical protein
MSAKDQDILVLNPVTGQLDMVRKFNADRIVTHMMNQAGNPLVVYDPLSGTYLSMDAVIVTDNNGNVVVA